MNRRIYFNKGTNDGLKKPEVRELFHSRWNVEQVTVRNKFTFVLFRTQVDCAEVVALKYFFVRNVRFKVGYAKGSFHVKLLRDDALQKLIDNAHHNHVGPKHQVIGLPGNQKYKFAGGPTSQFGPQNQTYTVFASAPRGPPIRAPGLLNKQQILVATYPNYMSALQQPGNLFVPKLPAKNFPIANFAVNIPATNNHLAQLVTIPAMKYSLPKQAQTNFGKLAVSSIAKYPLHRPY